MKNIASPLTSLLVLILAHAPNALAQASCSSDGTAQPVALVERFINADCEACWSDPAALAPSAKSGALVLDWIVPAASGDAAPLSAAATNDALARLQALGRKVPATTDTHITSVEPKSAGKLRVAHGLPLGDYIGTGIALAPRRNAKAQTPSQGGLNYHLLLVESVPAGMDGTAVPRHIVRNLLEGVWADTDPRPTAKTARQWRWMEARPMNVPAGAQAERLHMVGWVDDTQGRIVAAAQSVCR